MLQNEVIYIEFTDTHREETKNNKSYIPDEQLYFNNSESADIEAIKKTLENYMVGTSQGKPELIQKAFHPDLNLYSIGEDGSLRVLSGKQYIGYFKSGQKNDRVGRIVSIDVVNNAAVAKVEIYSASRNRTYTDYMMLLKIKDQWTIVHKSYTSESN